MTVVQISRDNEIGAYQVFLMTEEGCQASETYEYAEDRGAAFAKAQKTARTWAAEHGAEIETNY